MDNNFSSLQIGTGFDIHRLVSGRRFMLGGIEVPYDRGPLGHSDGDVVLHSVIDALLGATGSPDIGDLFPDTDLQYKDIPSVFLLDKTLDIIGKKNFVIHNLDVIIFLERPKIAQFKNAIRTKLSEIMKLSPEKIGIKAKTMEGLGEIGAGNAVACLSTVLVKKI